MSFNYRHAAYDLPIFDFTSASDPSYSSMILTRCEADTTLSAENDEVVCSVNGTKAIWKPQPIPQCYRHCYLFTVEHGDAYLINNRIYDDKQIIQLTTKEFGIGDNT
ncbi:unnamed protein product [Schistosoma curassoni]|uniref:Agglutinin domain-containing protein n=1 Tax=Schistosoma curassoni TaxID=6186 RepID=A0A183K149_9TREM|nr:unnamed protein product [Schistosoma curassoni]